MSNFLAAFDAYSLKARIYPALLAMLPLILAVITIFPAVISINLSKSIILTLLLLGLLYLMSNLARFRGKLAEPKLLERWGGWPSTILLRHRDATIDSYTKARYISVLAGMCPDLIFPNPNEESAGFEAADNIYRSATKRLIEARRGAEYKMLHDENIQYGFRRNAFGLKPVAVALALFSALAIIAMWVINFNSSLAPNNIWEKLSSDWHLPALVIFDVCWAIMWIVIFSEQFVLRGAYEYAVALLRTLDAS